MKKGFVLSLYRSPSQSKEKFYGFLFSLDQLLSNMISQNPICILVTGDFIATIFLLVEKWLRN